MAAHGVRLDETATAVIASLHGRDGERLRH